MLNFFIKQKMQLGFSIKRNVIKKKKNFLKTKKINFFFVFKNFLLRTKKLKRINFFYTKYIKSIFFLKKKVIFNIL